MDIEAIVKKHSGTMWIHAARIRNALTELAAEYEAVAKITKENSDRLLRKANERIHQLDAERVPDGYVKLGRVLAFVDAVSTDAKGLRHEYVESRSGSMVKVPDFHALAAPQPKKEGE